MTCMIFSKYVYNNRIYSFASVVLTNKILFVGTTMYHELTIDSTVITHAKKTSKIVKGMWFLGGFISEIKSNNNK